MCSLIHMVIYDSKKLLQKEMLQRSGELSGDFCLERGITSQQGHSPSYFPKEKLDEHGGTSITL